MPAGVEPTVGVDRGLDHLLAVSLAGDVRLHRDGVAAGLLDLSGGGFGAGAVQVGAHDPSALARKQPGGRLADAGGGAGDQRDLAVDPTH